LENAAISQMAPTTVSSSVRTREYLTTREIERLMAAARKSSRYGHRDATMILIGYRHGLRASELCDLQWSQVGKRTSDLRVDEYTLLIEPKQLFDLAVLTIHRNPSCRRDYPCIASHAVPRKNLPL
jgi:integrase